MGTTVRRLVGSSLAAALFASGVACSAPPATTPQVTTESVGVPSIPLPVAQSFVVSSEALEALGCAECDRSGTPDVPRFFYGKVPLSTVDTIVAGTAGDSRTSLGNMFVSGYFGGIYLRGSLAGTANVDVTPFKPLLDQIGAGTQAGLDAIVGELVRIAKTGTDQQVRDVSAAWSAILSAIAGYNRGYLEVALQHPPAGVTIPAGTFDCASLFDCRSTQLPLAALDQLSGQRNKLNGPPDLQWLSVATVANAVGNAAVPAGRNVWNSLLSSSSFSPTAYRSIIDLSVGFLEVTQAALLADLAGPTGGDIGLARKGLLSTAALVTWAGSYVLGLASPLPNSAQPTLTCS